MTVFAMTTTLPRRLTALVLSAVVAGCSSVAEVAVPGNSEYSCAGIPDGVVCASTRDVYARTEGRDRVHQADLEAGHAGEAEVAGTGPLPPRPRTGIVSPVVLNAAAATGSLAPTRQPPRIMRIWIAPWEDDRGFLRMPGHIFAEVTPWRWEVGGTGRLRASHGANHLHTPEMIEAENAAAEAAATGTAIDREGRSPVARDAPATPQLRQAPVGPRPLEVRS
ncbi:MAG: TraV family lipoprotein [Pseudomonadota bacterium]